MCESRKKFVAVLRCDLATVGSFNLPSFFIFLAARPYYFGDRGSSFQAVETPPKHIHP